MNSSRHRWSAPGWRAGFDWESRGDGAKTKPTSRLNEICLLAGEMFAGNAFLPGFGEGVFLRRGFHALHAAQQTLNCQNPSLWLSDHNQCFHIFIRRKSANLSNYFKNAWFFCK
jgi:hypothetical protein